MEDVYMRGFVGRREWCSDKVHLKSYFASYTNKIFPMKKASEIDILQHYVPQSNQLSEEELSNLGDITNGAHLTTMIDEDFCPPKKKERFSKEDSADSNILSSFLLKSEKKRNRIHQIDSNVRREVRLNAAENIGLRDLKPNKFYVVSFRIHEPFSHTIGDNIRPSRCIQQIDVLNFQRLCDLRDKIICEADFQDTRGDVSARPGAANTKDKLTREVYKSSMFYFDNTFYIDKRDEENKDYSAPIKKWAAGRGIKLGDTKCMVKTAVEDLEIRFGYPYVYMHQGSCEHLIIISDARVLSAKDSLYSADYPMMMRISPRQMVYCMTCSRFPARWIVRDSERLAHDPTYQCKTCFKLLHYVNGKKVCHFKAWQYWQKGVIL